MKVKPSLQFPIAFYPPPYPLKPVALRNLQRNAADNGGLTGQD